MGMSADFDAAIRLGATHVRVGSAIFGAGENRTVRQRETPFDHWQERFAGEGYRFGRRRTHS